MILSILIGFYIFTVILSILIHIENIIDREMYKYMFDSGVITLIGIITVCLIICCVPVFNLIHALTVRGG